MSVTCGVGVIFQRISVEASFTNVSAAMTGSWNRAAKLARMSSVPCCWTTHRMSMPSMYCSLAAAFLNFQLRESHNRFGTSQSPPEPAFLDQSLLALTKDDAKHTRETTKRPTASYQGHKPRSTDQRAVEEEGKEAAERTERPQPLVREATSSLLQQPHPISQKGLDTRKSFKLNFIIIFPSREKLLLAVTTRLGGS